MSQRPLIMATSSHPATTLSTQESTALITQEITSGAPNKTWASGRDWDQHRTQITQLYQTKPLREVMRIMNREFGFKATQRMYKNRIKQWGVYKNKKENEQRAIVRKRDQRQRQGKPSAFRVRGELVDFGDVVRYWERKGMSIEDVVAQRSMSATPDAVVECSTPVPSQPSTPKEFAILENLIRCVRDYHRGSFGSGTWYSKDPRFHCSSVKVDGDESDHFDLFFDQCRLACHLFDRFKYQEAGRTLICATAYIKEILQEEDPQMLIVLFRLVIGIAQDNRREIAIAILRQFADLGKVIVGSAHPISRVCGWLASLEWSQFRDVLDVCIHSASDQFEQFLGPMHWSTLVSRLNHALIPGTGLGESVSEKLASCIQSLGYCDVRTLNCYVALAYQYLGKGDFIAAQTLARQIILYSQDVEPQEYLQTIQSRGIYLLAKSQYRLGETASAVANLRQAIEMRMSIWGVADSAAKIELMELEKWVEEQGNLAYAAQLRDWRIQTLPSIEAEE